VQTDLRRVLELQSDYESHATPAMTERGLLVRKAIPAWIREHGSGLGTLLKVDDFFAKGSDGVGRKARVPWVRFGSESRSPSATEGFYVVYLFDAVGQTVFLSLNQGTTDMIGGDLSPKDPETITARVNWARSALTSWLNSVSAKTTPIDLHDSGLGAGYELGNIASVAYELNQIPEEPTLLDDAMRFAEGLELLYRQHDDRPIPGEQPELRESEDVAERSTGANPRKSRAGFRTNAVEIKAIEIRAVAVARAYYESEGFQVKELGKPFDLKVEKGDESLTVEVKGTTSDGSGVALTAGEVVHHAKAFPENALVVVRDIELHRDGAMPTASGGHLYEMRAWEIDPDALRVISYAYEVPSIMYDHSGVSSAELLVTPPG
jgi:hypothetical protein